MNYAVKVINVLRHNSTPAFFHKITRYIQVKTLPYFDYWFDLKHGVDTCGVVFHDDESDISSDERKTAVWYEATPVDAVRAILSQLAIDHSKYSFVDYGSGKGRILLLASEYPFKSIIGVEISKRLHERAEENLKACRYFNQRCFNVKSYCADATQFKLPNDPLIIFFFTPFRGVVMRRVIDNIQKSLYSNPRPLHIVYYGSRVEIIKMISDMKFAHQVIYSKRPLSALAAYEGHVFSNKDVMANISEER